MSSAKDSSADAALKQAGSRLGLFDAALKEIVLQNNQVDILTCYLDKAAQFASRSALFVVKAGNLVGWQARGCEGDFNNASIKTLVFPADRDNFLRKVADTGTARSTATAGNADVNGGCCKIWCGSSRGSVRDPIGGSGQDCSGALCGPRPRFQCDC